MCAINVVIQVYFSETTSVTYIVDAIYDDTQHSFGIFLIINDQRLLKVLAKQDQEPFVDLDIKVHQYSDAFNGTKCGFLCSKVKGSLLLLIDEYAVLCILSNLHQQIAEINDHQR